MANRKLKPWTDDDKAHWQAQRQERTAALMEQLEAGVQAIRTGEDFKRYLQAAARFHTYSPYNVLLIRAQRPDATHVAGYKTWQSLGRQVKKGEQAIYILAPRPYVIATEDEAGQEQIEREGIAFKPAAVFDIAQTTGIELPTVEAPTLTGDADQATYAALVAFATGQGLTITTHDPKTAGDDSRSSYNGYYNPLRNLIFVKQGAPAQMLKTLVHELAHHLDPELRHAPRAECETVAEATAFVVAAHQGIDTGTYSFPYVAVWASRQDQPAILKQVMGRVQGIAHQLLDHLEGTDDDSTAGGDEPPPATAVWRADQPRTRAA
jgi:antirestriction protein ArdC